MHKMFPVTISSNIYPLHRICLIFIGSILIALSAQMTIPLLPIPITLQTTAVLLLSILFGPSIGSSIIIIYLAEGLLGIPVFAHYSSGLPILLGPRGGYLLGFLPASIIAGYLAQQNIFRHPIMIFLNICISTFIIFIVGMIVLAHFVGWQKAYLLGVAPFYVTEFIKIMALTGTLTLTNKYIIMN